MRAGLLYGALALAGCSGSTTAAPPVAAMFRGADISALERIEQAGGQFRDSGRVGDAIAILRSHGANGFRLRLFVHPNDSDVQVNDLPYTLRMVARLKAAGAMFLLDFHYSDTWADPGHQTMPAAWAALSLDSLELRVQTYSADVIRQLKQANALPNIVQVGNEIDGGFLWPLGRVGGSYDTPDQWDHFTRLLKAAIRGVRSALSSTDSVRIMLHFSQGGSTSGTQWFVDHLHARGVPYDLVGFSYYPWWHGTLAELRANLQATALRYGVDVMVVETAYPWRTGGWEGFASNTAAMTWPVTPAGQAQFVTDVRSAVGTVPDGHGAGVVWWYPEAIPVSGLFVFAGGSLALFDSTGNVLPAASAFGAR